MKTTKIIIIIISAGLFAASCGLLYNPDFMDKVANGNSGTDITGANGEVIGAGTGNISGTVKSYVKTDSVTATIDGSNCTVNYSYPNWSIPLTSLASGSHSITITFKNADGNKLDSKDFTYNVPVYIATNGSDTLNSGNSPNSPFLLIQKGVDSLSNLNGHYGYIYIASGTYTPGAGLNASVGIQGVMISNDNIKINGGWNPNFTAHNGISVLNRQNNINGSHVITIKNCNNVQIDGLMLANGYRGIFASQINNCLLGDIVIQSNNLGIDMTASMSNHIIATISFNSNSTGGGINLNNCSWNSIEGLIVSNNNANNSGGGICMVNSYSNTVSSVVLCNKAGVSAGGIAIFGGSGNIISGNISSNSANHYAGMDIENSSGNIISGDVNYNSTTGGDAGGIYLSGGSDNIFSGNVNYNISTGNGGGIYINSGSGTITGNIIGNRCSAHGDALFIAGIYSPSKLWILNSMITNNFGGNSDLICIYSSDYQGLMISNCWIGGTNNSASDGIYASTNAVSTATNFIIVNNTFITNRIGTLYRDYMGGGVVITPATWANINDKTKMNAYAAYGNKVYP